MKYNPKEIFVTQQGKELYPDLGCGVASLLMLLKCNKFNPLPDWKELCNELGLKEPPVAKFYSEQDLMIGLSPENLFRYIVKKDLLFRMHFFDSEWQEVLKNAPIMVLLDGILSKYPDEAHWVVLTEYDGEHFTYLDPWYKEWDEIERNITLSNFKKYFTGIACQLLEEGLGEETLDTKVR